MVIAEGDEVSGAGGVLLLVGVGVFVGGMLVSAGAQIGVVFKFYLIIVMIDMRCCCVIVGVVSWVHSKDGKKWKC